MNKPQDSFAEVTALILRRVAPVLGDAATKILLEYLDSYGNAVAAERDQAAAAFASLQDENRILRGLIGVQEPDVLATILRQGEELRSLREQLMTAVKAADRRDADEHELRVALELARRENSAARAEQTLAQASAQQAIEKITQNLAQFETRIREQAEQFSREKQQLIAELQAAREVHHDAVPLTVAGEQPVQGVHE
jgi:hypothetical protein